MLLFYSRNENFIFPLSRKSLKLFGFEDAIVVVYTSSIFSIICYDFIDV